MNLVFIALYIGFAIGLVIISGWAVTLFLRGLRK